VTINYRRIYVDYFNPNYEYTEEGCFKGELLKEPPLPREHETVQRILPRLSHLKRRWLHYGCAVEELGRFMNAKANTIADESALVYHLHDQLTLPQTIDNNDGVGIYKRNEKGEPLFEARYVIAALTGTSIKLGVSRVLEEYFGFKKLAPFFGNVPHYGKRSKMGLYGVCTTRNLVDQKDIPTVDEKKQETHK